MCQKTVQKVDRIHIIFVCEETQQLQQICGEFPRRNASTWFAQVGNTAANTGIAVVSSMYFDNKQSSKERNTPSETGLRRILLQLQKRLVQQGWTYKSPQRRGSGGFSAAFNCLFPFADIQNLPCPNPLSRSNSNGEKPSKTAWYTRRV